jgi:PadR family transcriptional regulator, regulatory protein AphA
MSLKHAALGLLTQEPASGYDLLKKFKRSLSKVWPATQSQLYGELNKLAAAGLIKVADVGPRGRKEYAITDAGRAELNRWMMSIHDDPSPRSAVLLRVSLLGELSPTQAREHVASLRMWAEDLLHEYEELRASHEWSDSDSDFFALASLELLLRSARLDADWAGWLLEKLDERQKSGQKRSESVTQR